jgi:hypothetical protein
MMRRLFRASQGTISDIVAKLKQKSRTCSFPGCDAKSGSIDRSVASVSAFIEPTQERVAPL